MVWYSHLEELSTARCDPHSQRHIANKTEVDVFLELSCFFHDPADVGNLISSSSDFSKTNLNIWKFRVPILLKPSTMWITANWKILQEMGIPDHLTCLLRNMYANQEGTIRTKQHEQLTGSKWGKEYDRAVYCHPVYSAYVRRVHHLK